MAEDEMKPLQAPIIVERDFLVDGKKITVHVTFPAKLGKEIGQENAYLAAQGALVEVDAKKADVRPIKRGK